VDDKFCVWQFNFRDFNLQDDLYAQDSIELLKQSGIDFQVLQDQGIDPVLFGELLMSSGIVLNDEVSQARLVSPGASACALEGTRVNAGVDAGCLRRRRGGSARERERSRSGKQRLVG